MIVIKTFNMYSQKWLGVSFFFLIVTLSARCQKWFIMCCHNTVPEAFKFSWWGPRNKNINNVNKQ